MSKANAVVLAILVALIGAGSVQADLATGLVAHWKFDGDATDSAGSNDGTLVGEPTYTTGQIGGALDFGGADGVNIEGSAGKGSNLNIYNSNLTISAWINTSAIEDHQTIAARYKILTGAYRLGIDPAGRIHLNTYLQGSGHWDLFGDSVLETDTWYHIVGILDRGTGKGKVYVNGVEDAEGALGPNPLSNDAITRIGCRQNASDCPFNGVIDDVRIYNRALSGSEVSELYAIPEPATLALLALGGLILRKKR